MAQTERFPPASITDQEHPLAHQLLRQLSTGFSFGSPARFQSGKPGASLRSRFSCQPHSAPAQCFWKAGAGLVSDLPGSSHNPAGSNPCHKSVTPHHVGSSASPAEPGLISPIRSPESGRHSGKGDSRDCRGWSQPGPSLFRKKSAKLHACDLHAGYFHMHFFHGSS